MHGGYKLCFRGGACSEAVVDVCLDVLFFNVSHTVAVDDVVKEFKFYILLQYLSIV